MSETMTNEQAMQWCRAREISVNFVEVPGKTRLYFQGDLLMEGETLQDAIAKVKRYSRAALPCVPEIPDLTTWPEVTSEQGRD